MPDLPSHRAEPDAVFADRLETLLLDRLTRGSRAVSIEPAIEPRRDVTIAVDERPRPIDIEPAGALPTPTGRGRAVVMTAIGIAAAAVFVALAVLVGGDDEPSPADVPVSVPTAPSVMLGPIDRSEAFEGTWWSTDLDGSSQTMVVLRSGEQYVVALHDDHAGPCSESASTETGTGRIDATGTIVVPRLELTCDDGNTPRGEDGQPLWGRFELTFDHESVTDVVLDGFGVAWRRHLGAAGLLEDFLAARVEGRGATGYVGVGDQTVELLDEVPLLYATTSGARYERYEIARTDGPWFPDGETEFTVRLFADGGRTVVEQAIVWRDVGNAGMALVHDATRTTENGQPVPIPLASLDGPRGRERREVADPEAVGR